MRFGLVLDEEFTRHQVPSGHPERPERIKILLDTLHGFKDLVRVPPFTAPEEWITRVHSRELFRIVSETEGKDYESLDYDTHTGPYSFTVALEAAGSCVRLVELLNADEIDSGFAAVRPPGHHAESGRAMGFCFFNNVAVAAQWAIDHGAAGRVAIVDFDVHHGNGTQEIFYARNDVLYLSSHRYPFYPGSGTVGQVGEGSGEGFTVNFPLPAGAGDGFILETYREFALPILEEFEPDLILVSAGYDAHRNDPLGGMNMTEDGYAHLASMLNQTAQKTCQGRPLFVLEGGYNLRALSDSVAATLESVLLNLDYSGDFQPPATYAEYRKGLCSHFKRYWHSVG